MKDLINSVLKTRFAGNVSEMARGLRISRQRLDYLRGDGGHGGAGVLSLLCALRRLSRLSWSQLGKMLDEEFSTRK